MNDLPTATAGSSLLTVAEGNARGAGMARLDPRVVQGLVQLGAGAAAGLAGGLSAATLRALARPLATAAAWHAVASVLQWGILAGLATGAIALLLPPRERPGALLERWLWRGPAGPGDRSVGVLVALVLALQLVWLAGAWVDATFHHRLLSASLLTAVVLGVVPLAAAVLRVVERISGRQPELALALLTLTGGSLGLKLAWSPTAGALRGPLALYTGVLLAAAVWTQVHARPRVCLAALLASPVVLLLAYLFA